MDTADSVLPSRREPLPSVNPAPADNGGPSAYPFDDSRRRLFRITAGDGKGRYSATPVTHFVTPVPPPPTSPTSPPAVRGPDTFTDDASGYHGPRMDHTAYPLTEITGLSTVPVNTVVEAWPSRTSDSWEFQAGGGVTPDIKNVLDHVYCDALGQLVSRFTPVYGPAGPPPPVGTSLISGAVTVDGTPTAGRLVRASFGQYEWEATTDGDGSWSVPNLPGGDYVVWAVVTGTESTTAVVVRVPADSTGNTLGVTT